MKRIVPFLLSVLVMTPFLVFAAPNDLGDLIEMVMSLINPLIGLLTALAVLAFVWGIVKYISAAGDTGKKESGRNIMVYGVIGLFVLFSFWGIVRFIATDIFG